MRNRFEALGDVIEIARSEVLKQRWGEECNATNNEVKQSAMEDKRNWLEKRAAAAENAAEKGRNKELLLVFSVAPFKIDQNKNQNRSIESRNPESGK